MHSPWQGRSGLLRILVIAIAVAAWTASPAHAQQLSIGNAPDFGTAWLGVVDNPLYAYGGVGPGTYSWRVTAGSLPPGLALRTDGPTWWPSNVTASIAGVATTPGDYTFTLELSYPGLAPVSQACTMRVTPLLIADTYGLRTAVGEPYSYQFTAMSPVEPVSWTGSSLPTGFTLSSSGLFSGTPTTAGYFNFEVIASNGVDTVSRWVGLDVRAIRIVTSGLLPLGAIGQPYSAQIVVEGGTPPYTFNTGYTSNEILSGIFLDPATGAVAGTPTYASSTSFSLTVTDSQGVSTWKYISLAVPEEPPTLPQVSYPDLYNATIGMYSNWRFYCYGGTPPYRWSADGLPAGMSLRVGDDTQIEPLGAILDGSPVQAGTFTIHVTLTDANGLSGSSPSLPLHVSTIAEWNSSLPTGQVNHYYSGRLRVIGGTPPYTASLLPTWRLPYGLVLNPTTLEITGTPREVTRDWVVAHLVDGAQETLDRWLWVSVTDASGSTIYINTWWNLGSTTVGSSYSRTFSACCVPSYVWSLGAGALPPGVTFSSTGILSGTPTVAGTYDFEVRVADGQNPANSAAQFFEIVVEPGPPISLSYSYNLPYANVGTLYSTQLGTASGGSGDLTWSLASGVYLPAGLTLSQTGLLSGTPAFPGSYYLSVVVSDTSGNSTTRGFSISIYPAGQVPPVVFSLSPISTYLGSTTGWTISPTGGVPPYTVTASGLPPGYALLTGTALYSTSATPYITGVAQVPGVYHVTVTVDDAAGHRLSRTANLTIAPFSLPFMTQSDYASVGQPYSFLLRTTTPVAWSLQGTSSLPPGLQLVGNSIIGTPTTAGTYSIPLLATDQGSGLSASWYFYLQVSAVSIQGPTLLPGAVSGQPYSYTFTSTGGGSPLTWSAYNVPSGLTLSSAGVLSGTPSSYGTYSVRITATDGIVPIVKIFDLFVSPASPTQLNSTVGSTPIDIALNATYSASLSTSGGTPPVTWTVAPGSSLPDGLQLTSGASLPVGYGVSPATTLLGGSARTVGQYTFDLLATDSAGTQLRRTFTVNVTPVYIVSSLRTATVGVPFEQQIVAVGGTPPYTFTIRPRSPYYDMLPPGLQITAGGRIYGTPQSTGYYYFWLDAEDADHHRYSRAVSFGATNAKGIYVANSNPGDTSVGRGTTLSLYTSWVGTGSDMASPVWSKTAGDFPPGMTLSPSGELSGAPSVVGVFTYTLRVTDSNDATNFAEHVFTHRVTPMQLVSGRTATPYELPVGHVDTPYSATLRMAGGTPPYTFAVSPFSSRLPTGINLNAGGELSGTPVSIGLYSITVAANDSAGHALTFSLSLPVAPASAPYPLTRLTTALDNASLGVPYAFSLDAGLRGGVAPYRWTFGASSTIPDGMNILDGENGLPALFAGVPTTAGTYPVVFVVTDARGASVTTTSSFVVSQLAATPDSLPPGTVGLAYTGTALMLAGGTPPYTFGLSSNSDMPAGMSVLGGVLSGTPTSPGRFTLRFSGLDASGNTVSKNYRLTIDDTAGSVPAVTVAPKPVQLNYQQGLAVPPPVSVNVATTGGSPAFTAALLGLTGVALTPASGTAPAALQLTIDTAAHVPGTYSGLLGVSAPQSANEFDWAPVVLTVTAPPACAFAFLPSSATLPAAGGSSSFTVATDAWCDWSATVSAASSWISITSSTSGKGGGTVSYSVAPNNAPGSTQRTGSISVGGVVFTITQFGTTTGCSFVLTPATLTLGPAGGIAMVTVSASDAACGWTSTPLLLTITPSAGTGTQQLAVTVPANGGASRVLTASVAGKTLTVNQAGLGCTFTLVPSTADFNAAGGNGTVSVLTPVGCSFEPVSEAAWVTVTSRRAGTPPTIGYSVQPNSTTSARATALVVGDQRLRITQAAQACSVSLDTTALVSPFGSSGGAGGTIGVTTNGTNCGWTASSDVGWATVSPSSGTGSGVVTVTIASNGTSATARQGLLTIAGQNINVSQAGRVCTFALQSDTGTVPAAGASGAVGVVTVAGCGWTASTDSAAWLTVGNPAGTGSSDVRFVVQQNLSTFPRVGTLTIAGLTYTVTQAAAPCSYTLALPGINVSSNGGSGSVGFTASGAGCSATAASYASWITATTRAGAIDYSVLPNASGYTRTGTIQLGDQTFTITQNAGDCAYSLQSYGAAFGPDGGPGNVIASQGAINCSPVVGTTQPTIVTLGPLSGPVLNIFTQAYTVSPFVSVNRFVRYATITFSGQFFTIKQLSW